MTINDLLTVLLTSLETTDTTHWGLQMFRININIRRRDGVHGTRPR